MKQPKYAGNLSLLPPSYDSLASEQKFGQRRATKMDAETPNVHQVKMQRSSARYWITMLMVSLMMVVLWPWSSSESATVLTPRRRDAFVVRLPSGRIFSALRDENLYLVRRTVYRQSLRAFRTFLRCSFARRLGESRGWGSRVPPE